MKKIKIGQEVWFKSTWAAINSGIVTEIRDENETGYVKIKGTRETYGAQHAKIENCYPTKEALLAGLRAECDKAVKDYCNSIQTVEDLVRFCYKYNFSAEEYTDYEAAEAARIRAKELLGLELE